MLRTFIQLLSVSILALTVASRLPGDVALCLGADGHLAIEVASTHGQHEDCATEGLSATEAETTSPAAVDCHVDCIDLAVCGSDIELASQHDLRLASPQALPPAPLAPALLFAVSAVDVVPVPPRGPPRPAAYLAERATVQLLI